MKFEGLKKYLNKEVSHISVFSVKHAPSKRNGNKEFVSFFCLNIIQLLLNKVALYFSIFMCGGGANGLSEIVYNIKNWKLLSVCETSFKSVCSDESMPLLISDPDYNIA